MDDFSNVTIVPPVESVRDERRLLELVVRMNKAIPAVEAIEAVAAVAAVEANEEEGIEAVEEVLAVEGVAFVAAVPAGIKVGEIELRYANFSRTNEKTNDNPDGVINQNGANLYKGEKAQLLKTKLFKAGAKAEIETRLAENNIDQ